MRYMSGSIVYMYLVVVLVHAPSCDLTHVLACSEF
jgi:hypothetical protein